MLYVGIDCGENTGVALYNSETRQLERLETVQLHQALSYVLYLSHHEEAVTVVFEDARKRQWFKQEKNMAEYRGKLMGAGSVKRDCTIWEEFLTFYKIPFLAIPPQRGATKWPAETFNAVTGWQGKSNEHNRDAALLVWGRR